MVDDLFQVTDDGAVVLSVHAQPGAGRSAVVGRHGAALKVKVAAPPEGGRANEAVAGLLAERFGLQAGAVTLVSGASSRAKRFRLEGVAPELVARELARLVGADAPARGGVRDRRR